MTEILLEVTTEEIRSAAQEAAQRAKGKSRFLNSFVPFIIVGIGLNCVVQVLLTEILVLSGNWLKLYKWLYIGYSQQSASAVPPVFEIIDPKTW